MFGIVHTLPSANLRDQLKPTALENPAQLEDLWERHHDFVFTCSLRRVLLNSTNRCRLEVVHRFPKRSSHVVAAGVECGLSRSHLSVPTDGEFVIMGRPSP